MSRSQTESEQSHSTLGNNMNIKFCSKRHWILKNKIQARKSQVGIWCRTTTITSPSPATFTFFSFLNATFTGSSLHKHPTISLKNKKKRNPPNFLLVSQRKWNKHSRDDKMLLFCHCDKILYVTHQNAASAEASRRLNTLLIRFPLQILPPNRLSAISAHSLPTIRVMKQDLICTQSDPGMAECPHLAKKPPVTHMYTGPIGAANWFGAPLSPLCFLTCLVFLFLSASGHKEGLGNFHCDWVMNDNGLIIWPKIGLFRFISCSVIIGKLCRSR